MAKKVQGRYTWPVRQFCRK